ncbi:hypothetical protein [Paenibacillus sp. HB172176]|uniref:hypothetical protein n=1 Tax=Paenibacillus sp. HB172176 TaxID=2493690 RepID=UPI0014395B71|nr:hypothetical protein [Paenibacillus sp. HB172176]
MIALLIAVTISAVSVGLSSYYSIAQSSRQDAPFSYMLLSQGGNFDEAVKRIIVEDTQHPVTVTAELEMIKTIADIGSLPIKPTGYASDEVPVKLISASGFNAAQTALNREEQVRLLDDPIHHINRIVLFPWAGWVMLNSG